MKSKLAIFTGHLFITATYQFIPDNSLMLGVGERHRLD
jgi:hypothetical protein